MVVFPVAFPSAVNGGTMTVVANIELYEALKKSLDEDAARMIAEVVPAAADLSTKSDLLGLEGRLTDRITSLERRMFTFVLVPMWAAIAAGVVKLFVR